MPETSINKSFIRKSLKTEQQVYAFYGAIFGCLFPIIGTLIEAYSRYGSVSVDALVLSQTNSQLLWIIDTAPFFLGVLLLSVVETSIW